MHGDQMLRQWQLRIFFNSNALQYLQAIVETSNLHVSCMPQLGTASFVSDAFLSEYSLRRSSFSCKILSQSPLESLMTTLRLEVAFTFLGCWAADSLLQLSGHAWEPQFCLGLLLRKIDPEDIANHLPNHQDMLRVPRRLLGGFGWFRCID